MDHTLSQETRAEIAAAAALAPAARTDQPGSAPPLVAAPAEPAPPTRECAAQPCRSLADRMGTRRKAPECNDLLLRAQPTLATVK